MDIQYASFSSSRSLADPHSFWTHGCPLTLAFLACVFSTSIFITVIEYRFLNARTKGIGVCADKMSSIPRVDPQGHNTLRQNLRKRFALTPDGVPEMTLLQDVSCEADNVSKAGGARQ